MLKIGVIGAGHLGKIHLKCIKEVADYQLVGFYDIEPSIARAVQSEYGVIAFSSPDELIEAVDVVDIVTPTVAHFEYASQAIRRARHVFIEKPVVATPEEALKLMEMAREADVQVQVGHVERFNPALTAVLPGIKTPLFIEAHRLSTFSNRGIDVPVILDLMIHDIDVVLHIVKANLRKVSASGVSVISSTADIANARLEFDNGCVANLTASRISLKPMRKMRIFQRDAYITVDFLDKKAGIIKMKDLAGEQPESGAHLLEVEPGKPRKQLVIENPVILPVNAIATELQSFATSILNNSAPKVSITDGYQALVTAHQIMEKVNYSISNL